MKKREIENMLKNVSDEFVPNALDKVMANCSQQKPESDVIAIERGRDQNKTKMLIFAMFATLILIFGMLTGGHLYFNADDSFVYVDINPSIELAINRMGNVKNAVAKNSDGETLLSGQSLNGLSLEDAILHILKLAVDQHYIDSVSDDNEVMFSVFNDDLEKADKQMEKIGKCANQFRESNGIKFKIDKEVGNKKEKDNAAKQGLSPAKLKLIQSIVAKDSSRTIESLKDYSVKDLQKLLKELTKNKKQ